MEPAANTCMIRPFRFSFNATDLIVDTQHLTPEAFGCLMRFMLSYWRVGPPPDDNDALARIAGLSTGRWGKVREHVEPFFDVRHGQWVHEALDRELRAAYEAIARNKEKTKAATERRRKNAHARQRESECDDERDDERDVVPIHAPHVLPDQTSAQAKEEKCPSRPDYADDVSTAERDLGIGGGA